MKRIQYTNHPINKNNYISAGWSHDRNYYHFPRTLSEAGIKWNPEEKSKSQWYESLMLLLAAFLLAFIIAGVSLYGV